MFLEKLKEEAKNSKILVLFDMDGTCVEFGTGEKQKILDNEPNFYLNKRPLKTVIKIMDELQKLKNVEVGILSNCYYPEQKQDKITWLKHNIPNIKDENIHIIVYAEVNITEKSKRDDLKVNYILKNLNKSGSIICLIEDQHSTIVATNKKVKNMAHHISELIP